MRRNNRKGSLSSQSYGAVSTSEPPSSPVEEAAPIEEGDEGSSSNPKQYTSLGTLTVKDHFSLSNPSSLVRFVDEETLIFTDNTEQVTLEKKKGEDFITAKQATVSSPGMMALRLAYTLITVFMTGILLVFCIQLVLFLFLGLAIESGMTSDKNEINVVAFLGTFFAIPVFVYALSQAMTVANTFVIDTFKGSKFMKTILSWDSVLVDWISFSVFFGIPALVASITLYMEMREWWTVTSIVWFALVVGYYLVFGIMAIYYEIDGCLELIAYHPKFHVEGEHIDDRSFKTFERAIALRLKQILSGYKTVTYTATGSDKTPDTTDFGDILKKESLDSYMSPYSWVTMQKFADFFFDPLDEPIRQYSVDDVLEYTPYITSNTWGLEHIYCGNSGARFIAIINGTSKITAAQARSSFACFAFGFLVNLGVIVGFLHFMGAGGGALVVVAILYTLSAYQSLKSQVGLVNAYTHVSTRETGETHANSDALYQVQETYRVSEPRTEMYWLFLVVSVICFVILPITGLFSAGNTRIGTIFILMASVTLLRSICSAPACLQELGSLDGIEVNNEEKNERAEWREKHRLGTIVTEISVGRRSQFWVGVISFIIFGFCACFLSAIILGSDDGATDPVFFAGNKTDFLYPGSDSLDYASCALTANIVSPEDEQHAMVDFAFLSTIAYLDDKSALDAATSWFNVEVDIVKPVVHDFSKSYQAEHGASSVAYKLFHFPGQDLNVVSVRGTANSWDALSDAQIWDGAMYSQMVRAALPFGSIWDSLLPYLVKAISFIEDNTLKEVTYYKETTAFVKKLKEDKYPNVQIIGHSLGGGLAMITGAQTHVPAIALSGPNGKLSRFTFDPPVNLDDLNEWTFNVIPDRDPVPRIDDLAKNYQRIACRSAPNKPVDCHYGKRSLCEILYTCGSSGRPVPCYCHQEYGYPKPKLVSGIEFNDACPSLD